jgi:formylglycine-generating enzyme required for sulfatase activity
MTGSTIPDRLAQALSDRYRLERELGEGGTAVVYLATDLKHSRKVALKVLRPELAVAVGPDRFLAEIRTTANLQHPHILPLFDSGEADGFLYYVMPYVAGESLRERLDRDGALPEDQALAIAADVASALSHAHERGIIHRDIKPANVLLSDGEALVADFGIALALSEVGPERRTKVGMSVGTPWYMSPEQIDGGKPVDGRTDVYALGCLLFEMLTGERPYESPTLQGVLAKALTDPVPSVRERRPTVREDAARAVRRAMAKDPGERFQSASELGEACRLPSTTALGGRRPALILVAVALLVVVTGVSWFSWRVAQRAEARATLPDIARLVEEERYVEAYGMAVAAEGWLPGDSTLADLMLATSDLLSFSTDPPGADVFLQRFDPDPSQVPAERRIGTTPLEDVRVPRADHRVVLRLDGFVPVERIASSGFGRERNMVDVGRQVTFTVTMTPQEEAPEGMVRVPGGEYRLASPDAPSTLAAVLEPFFVGRYEVTNEGFARFVQDGGYEQDQLWDGVAMEARASLVDRTGLPGPATWTRQRYPDEEDRLPVSGVSWWEAQAFCRWSGGRLPTVFEWEKTARDGELSYYGVLMPWGVQTTASRGERRANFNTDGPTAVDAFPFGIGPYGTYGMAGNVREWTLNSYGAGRAVTGGSWQGPSYLYTEYASESPDFRSPGLGFRCVVAPGSGDQGGGRIDLDVVPPEYRPVDRGTFEELLRFYRYDPLPANPRVTDVQETAAWTRERIWIDGASGDSVLLYFYAPRSVDPPYQTLVFVPGSSVFSVESLPDDAEWTMGPAIQAGRAVLTVVMQGMIERSFPPGTVPPDPPSVGFRDLMVRHATELRLAMDYAEARDDVDPDRFAYVATSWGAGSRLAFAAVDDRYRAVVLIGAGIDERVKPTLPEADNVNFAPYIDAPTLVINGTNDEEHPWLSRAEPLWRLLSDPKELALMDGGGHIPPAEFRIPVMNAFLDEHLGPVRRR